MSVDSVVPRDTVDEEARRRVDVEPSHVHHDDAHHRERTVVQRRRTGRRLVLHGERVAIEVGEGGLAPPDLRIGLVGEGVDAGERAQ